MSRNGSGNAQDQVRGLEADATRMMKELEALTSRLRDLGKAPPEDVSQAAINSITEQFQSVQKALSSLTGEGNETLAKLDKSVRANPWLYILGALGIGVLLGKARRS